MTIGIIGGGNIGTALITGMIRAGKIKADEAWISDRNLDQLNRLEENHPGIRTTSDNKKVSGEADVLFLAVKPNIYPAVISDIKGHVKEGSVVISVAAGQTMETVRGLFAPHEIKLVRIMPNTPVLVRQGMTALCPGDEVTDEEALLIQDLLSSVGRAVRVKEDMMDVVTAVSGSSPAFTFLYIESLADGAVKQGMSRSLAYEFASQAVLGAAQLVRDSGKHPGMLKDEVCSPGGTTIHGIATLEAKGFRSLCIEAVSDAVERAHQLGKKS